MKIALKRLSIVLALSVAGTAFAAPTLIIKYKPTPTQAYDLQTGKISAQGLRSDQMKSLSTTSVNKLSSVAGVKVQEVSQIATGAHVMALPEGTTDSQTQQIIKAIQADPSVAYVEENRRVYAKTVPALNPEQWDMQESFATSTTHPTWQGDNLYGVSTIESLPGSGVVVGVLDTGYTPHQNFLSNLVPYSGSSYGYQFISDCLTAGSCSPSNVNASIAYAPNGLDLGDYLTQAQINANSSFFSGCPVEETSSWHGTHVTGTVIGQGYGVPTAGAGVVGGAYGATVVPVRVLGKCGGYLSDIENGMLWVAGMKGVTDNAGGTVPTNPKPADILSMSLGSSSPCSASEQDVINTVTANGTNGKVFVVAAGNEKSNVSTASPANCQNVISVAAKGPENDLAWYSNYGATSITASGGNTEVNDLERKIYSTIWSSPQAYSSSGTGVYDYMQGTSMATPHVSAAVADIMSALKVQGKTWNTATIIAILQNSADNLNKNCLSNGGCVTKKSAMNAAAAVTYAQQNYGGSLTPSAATVAFTSGNTGSVTFTNSNSSGSITVTSTSVNTSGITASQGCNKSIPAGGTCSVTLSASAATSGTLTLTSNNMTVASVAVSVTAPPAPSSSGGGGCTAIANGDDISLILLLLSFSAIYVFRKKYLKLKRT